VAVTSADYETFKAYFDLVIRDFHNVRTDIKQVKDGSAFDKNGAFFAKSVDDGAVFDLREMGLGDHYRLVHVCYIVGPANFQPTDVTPPTTPAPEENKEDNKEENKEDNKEAKKGFFKTLLFGSKSNLAGRVTSPMRQPSSPELSRGGGWSPDSPRMSLEGLVTRRPGMPPVNSP